MGRPPRDWRVRYLIECVIDDEHDKQAACWSAAYAYGISLDLSKFFYSWVLAEMRHSFFDKIHIPFTEHELLLAAESYTLLPTVINIVGIPKTKELIAVLGGTRFKLPTIAYLTKLKEDYRLFRELDKSDLDPDSVAAVARAHKKTPRTAQEVYNEMVTILDPKRYGEHSIYDQHERDY
jgi:hypothetical protein